MSQRRRTGFRGPELRGTLGTLLRSTLEQAGVVRDAIERGAREGRSRLEEARAGRKRTELLADLGEAILDLIRGGEIDVAELPEIRGLVRELDDLDAHADAEVPSERVRSVATPPSRSRFDDRPRGVGGADQNDGTVGSAIGAGVRDTLRAAAARVWRPPAGPGSHAEPDSAPRAPRREPDHRPLDPSRKGGISFDDDLADYMHPDDVPPRGDGGDGGNGGA